MFPQKPTSVQNFIGATLFWGFSSLPFLVREDPSHNFSRWVRPFSRPPLLKAPSSLSSSSALKEQTTRNDGSLVPLRAYGVHLVDRQRRCGSRLFGGLGPPRCDPVYGCKSGSRARARIVVDARIHHRSRVPPQFSLRERLPSDFRIPLIRCLEGIGDIGHGRPRQPKGFNALGADVCLFF